MESRLALSAVPLNAQPLDTGEFMLGDVSVTVVFFESDGSEDANTEDWNAAHAGEVKARIEEGLQWWVDTLALQSSVHELNFEIDYTYADNPIPIGIEPISRVATDLDIWVGEFLDHVGAERTDHIDDDVRLFNHSQRVANDTNWTFTLFVINAENDTDGFFAPGSVRGAFSIAGGAFMAVPSKRPASTIAHEVSHQFWAMDEYEGSGDYEDTRGYYNTQNTNAHDGHPSPEDIETSLLGHSDPLLEAYATHTSSTASFETIGWKDSDGDGIFDVYDLPISFSASGQFDPASQQMRIIGDASIGVLPNQNSAGLQNSITTNRLSHLEFRVDGGVWQTGPTIDAYSANFDFLIQLPDANQHDVEVRIVDQTGHIQSASLLASTEHVDSTDVHGFTGYITYDANGNGSHDAGEQGLSGWLVEVVDLAGNPQITQTIIEPDDYPQGEIFYDPIGGVTLLAEGPEIDPDLARIGARNSSLASTGERGFTNYSDGSWSNVWSSDRQMNITFDTPVSRVAIDAIAEVDGDIGILELYDAQHNLLGRYTTAPMAGGSSETMVIELTSADATYAIARGHIIDEGNPSRSLRYVGLDNLQVGRPNSAITNQLGAFSLPFDVDGDYRLRVTAPDGKESFFNSLDELNVALTSQAGSNRTAWSVSIADDSWHNPMMTVDVNHDGTIDQSDFDMVLSELVNPQFTSGGLTQSRVFGLTHAPGDPYFDLNADGRFNKLDLLLISDALAFQARSQSAIAAEPFTPLVYSVVSSPASDNLTVASSPSIAPTELDSLEGEFIVLTSEASHDDEWAASSTDDATEPVARVASLQDFVLPSQASAVIDSIDHACQRTASAQPLDDEAVDAILSDLDASFDLL
ncbi:hypothetical protein AB1K70_09375 [Bremerella sp. JC770]|uniref:hypothetical protein n=1 Tax=Bremerella sp. JC770 TaxID=3232137 RepID=UPI00345744EA